MRRALSILLLAILPTTALAAPPASFSTTWSDPGTPVMGCDGFDVIYAGSGTITARLHFDAQGAPAWVEFHARAVGTLTNSATGYAIEDHPSVVTIITDLASGEEKRIGVFFQIEVPGEGAVIQLVGISTWDGAGNLILGAGPHNIVDDAGVLCDVLSEG